MPSTKQTTDNHSDDYLDIAEINDGTRRSQVYFPSNVMGNYLVNAVDGNQYPYKRGSVDQLRYFQVVDSRGVIDNDGVKRKRISGSDNDSSRDPNYLYYNSPEEYLNHCKNQKGFKRLPTVSQEQIDLWHQRQKYLFPRGVNNIGEPELDQDAYNEYINAKNNTAYVDDDTVSAIADANARFMQVRSEYPPRGCPTRLGFTHEDIANGFLMR